MGSKYSRAISSLAECKNAAHAYYESPGSGFDVACDTVIVESNDNDPPGCFIYSVFDDHRVYYNSNWGPAQLQDT
jgi:hypothetical protein